MSLLHRSFAVGSGWKRPLAQVLIKVGWAWIQLSQVMTGNQQLGTLTEKRLTFLAEYLDAHASAFFVSDGDDYRRVASIASEANTTCEAVHSLLDFIFFPARLAETYRLFDNQLVQRRSAHGA